MAGDLSGAASKDLLQYIKDLMGFIGGIFKAGGFKTTEFMKRMATKKQFGEFSKDLWNITKGGKERISWQPFSAEQKDMYRYVLEKIKEEREKGSDFPYIENSDTMAGASIIYTDEAHMPYIKKYCMQYSLSKGAGAYNRRLDVEEYSNCMSGSHACILRNMSMDTVQSLQMEEFGEKNSFPFTTTVNNDGSVNLAVNRRNFMTSRGMDALTTITVKKFDIHDEVAKYENDLERKVILNEGKKTFFVVPLDGATSDCFLRVSEDATNNIPKKCVDVYSNTGRQIKHIETRSDDTDGMAFASQVYECLNSIKDPCIVETADVKCHDGMSVVEVLAEHGKKGNTSDFVRMDEKGNPVIPRKTMTNEEKAKVNFTKLLIKETERPIIAEDIENNIGDYKKLAENLLMTIYDEKFDDINLIKQYHKDFGDALVNKILNKEDYTDRASYQEAAVEAFRDMLDSANGVLQRLDHVYSDKRVNDFYIQLLERFSRDADSFRNNPVSLTKNSELTVRLRNNFDTMVENIKQGKTDILPEKIKRAIQENSVKGWLGEIRECFNDAISIEREEFLSTREDELLRRISSNTDMDKNKVYNNINEAKRLSAKNKDINNRI